MSKDSKEFDDLEQYDYSDGEYLDKVTHKYCPLIGFFLITFSKLENELNTAIAEYIQHGTHETGFVIIEKITTSNKIDLFYKLYLGLTSFSKNPKYKIDLIAIKKELNELNSFRNALVHANWESLNKEGYVRTKIVIDDKEGYVKFKKVEVLTKTIRKRIKEAEKLSDKLYTFKDDLMVNI